MKQMVSVIKQMKKKICKKEFYWRISEKLRMKLNAKKMYHIYQPLRSGRIWHKVNF